MRCRQLLICIGLLGCTWWHAPTTFAQHMRQVTVELKNGDTLRGKMAVTAREDYLTLQRDRYPMEHIPYRKIRRLTFGKYLEPGDQKQFQKRDLRTYIPREKKFFHIGELSLLVGDQSYEPNTAVGFQMVNGYRFSPHLGVGLGIGLDHYGPVTTLPLFAHVRGTVLKRKVSPYYFASAGASPAWGRSDDDLISDLETRGGWMFHTGLGYQFDMHQCALLFHVGFKAQQTSATYTDNGWWDGGATVEEDRTIHRMTFGVGLIL